MARRPPAPTGYRPRAGQAPCRAGNRTASLQKWGREIDITTKSAPVSASARVELTSYLQRDTAFGWALILFPMISFRAAASSISWAPVPR